MAVGAQTESLAGNINKKCTALPLLACSLAAGCLPACPPGRLPGRRAGRLAGKLGTVGEDVAGVSEGEVGEGMGRGRGGRLGESKLGAMGEGKGRLPATFVAVVVVTVTYVCCAATTTAPTSVGPLYQREGLKGFTMM